MPILNGELPFNCKVKDEQWTFQGIWMAIYTWSGEYLLQR